MLSKSIRAWLAAASALAGAGMCLALVSCAGRGSSAADNAAPAAAMLGERDVARVARADLVSGVSVSGDLNPQVDVAIISPIAEVIDQVLVREGQPVRRGQVLARFRASALAPAAASAEAQLRIARVEYGRMQNLYAEGAISQRDLDGAEVALRAAESGAAMAAKQLDEATVRAPEDGVVASRLVHSGDRVKDGVPLFRLVNTSELEFEATVRSEVLSRVRVGAPVPLSVVGFPDGSIVGRLARVNVQAEPATRQVRVYVQVPNPDGRLAGGLFASGRVIEREARGVLAVPLPGIHSAPAGGHYVWVVEKGRIARRNVTLGVIDEIQNLVEVISGLAPGDVAVVGPVEGLATGQRVQVSGGA